MDDIDMEKHWMMYRQEKYKKLYARPKFATEEGFHPKHRRQGGVFTTKTRNQLLGISEKAGRDRTKANFWYDVRETVKTALIDLQLFLETAEDKNVNKVLNVVSLASVIDYLLNTHVPKKDPERAMVASMLIERSFQYLRELNQSYLMPSQERQIEDAINLGKQLTLLVLPEDKRSSFLLSGGRQP